MHVSVLTWPTLYGSNADYHYGWVVRPAEIGYTGDGSGNLGGPYRSHTLPWGPAHLAHVDIDAGARRRHRLARRLTPDCASGSFHLDPVRLRAFRVVGGHFTRLTLT